MARGERHFRFVAVFRGQAAHRGGADIGWIAEDQVVGFSGDGRKEVRVQQPYAVLQPVFADIAPGHGQRVRRQIHAIHGSAGPGVRGNNGQAAGAGAQVEYC